MRRHLPRVLIVTPPLLQFTAPYPASPMLAAFLRQHGVPVTQADLSLELGLRLFSRAGIAALLDEILRRERGKRAAVLHFFVANARRYLGTINGAIRFLQTGDPKLAARILDGWLPSGPRFRVLSEWGRVLSKSSPADSTGRARLLASLYLDDLGDVVRSINPRFGLSRYAERLTSSARSFTTLSRRLEGPPDFIERLIDDITVRWLARVRPGVVGITIPFPGCLYGALRVARQVKRWDSRIRTVAGGGFVNTELRNVKDRRLFDYFDYLTYDDGELPFLQIVKHAAGLVPAAALIRTKALVRGEVVSLGMDGPHLRHRERPTPDYRGLPLSRYCPMVETVNPMARLWTERRWLKLVLAYGCYWHKCAFCDTSLDYICRYDPADVATIVGWIRGLIEQTGETGFHFADEAAPPHLLGRLAEELLRQKIRITWWTNIRFEKAFTPQLARLLASAGCIAVTGGIECAEKDLLAIMTKGVTLPEAARAMNALARAGIMVHSYLMYGFPGQTVQQTVDALELVRQLFREGCLHSAFWHRFALTIHSRIYAEPTRYGVKQIGRRSGRFTENEVPFADGLRVDHVALGEGLRRAVYNYMHGIGIEEDVRSWFPFRVPRPRLAPNTVSRWIHGKES